MSCTPHVKLALIGWMESEPEVVTFDFNHNLGMGRQTMGSGTPLELCNLGPFGGNHN